MRFQPLLRSGKPRAGVTLIELLVAMVGFLLIGGAILEIYDETQKAAQKMIRRQASIDFAVDFADRSADLLREAVDPANLDLPVAGVVFQNDRFSAPAYGTPASNGLFLVTLRPREGADDGRRYEVVRETLGGGAESTAVIDSAFGLALTEGEPTVTFRYATEARPGQPVNYKERLVAGEWPALVEISVQVQPKGDGEEPVLMKTAVIPGRLPTVRVAAPAPPPEVAPASPADPAQSDAATTPTADVTPEAAETEAAGE
jgi:hypothetical protein